MARKKSEKSKVQPFYRRWSKYAAGQPLLIAAVVLPLIILIAWLCGGFSPVNKNLFTEPSSLNGVQTLPHSQVSVAPLPPPDLLWQGVVQPVVITPNTPPVLYKIPISQPVVFLSIDDGWAKPQDGQDWLVAHRLPFSLFLTNDAVKSNYDYFQKLQAAGMVIENHTLDHPRMTRLSLDKQQSEICATADIYKNVYGHRPTLFRPPYGLANAMTLQAATACGMRAIVMWHASIQDGVIHYQDGNHLVAGDIVLMHFHSNMVSDLQAFFNQVQSDHLQVGRLEDWVK